MYIRGLENIKIILIGINLFYYFNELDKKGYLFVLVNNWFFLIMDNSFVLLIN